MTREEVLNRKEEIRLGRIHFDILEEALDAILETLPTDADGDALTDTAAILETISRMKGTFTMDDVHRKMSEEPLYTAPSKPSLSAALSKLAKAGEIDVIQPGAGRRATIYERFII